MILIPTKKGVTIKDEAGANTELPSDFPTDVMSIYDDSTIVSASTIKTDVGKHFNVALTTKDSQKDVVDFYKQVFDSKGWDMTLSQSTKT